MHIEQASGNYTYIHVHVSDKVQRRSCLLAICVRKLDRDRFLRTLHHLGSCTTPVLFPFLPLIPASSHLRALWAPSPPTRNASTIRIRPRRFTAGTLVGAVI